MTSLLYLFTCYISVDGNWTPWSEYGPCSATCDAGFEQRLRTCTAPCRNQYGEDCYGDDTQTRCCAGLPSCTSSCAGGTSAFDDYVPVECLVSCPGTLQIFYYFTIRVEAKHSLAETFAR